MFVEDYRELKLEDGARRRSVVFSSSSSSRSCSSAGAGGASVQGQSRERRHPRALPRQGADQSRLHARLAERLPGRNVTLLDTGCCGMAGAFGMLSAKYELSLKVAEPLVEKVCHQPPDTVVVASGTSCRHQIEHLTPVHPKHMAEFLAEAIAKPT